MAELKSISIVYRLSPGLFGWSLFPAASPEPKIFVPLKPRLVAGAFLFTNMVFRVKI